MGRKYKNWQRKPSVTAEFPVQTSQRDGLPREHWQRQAEADRLRYEAALEAAGGDDRRLQVEADGSITILNQARLGNVLHDS